jgi:hypothetical protein
MRLALTFVVVFSCAAAADAQEAVPAPRSAARLASERIDGPAPPQPPAVIARDGAGQITIRAVRVTAPIEIDGRLDEAVYANVPPMSDFVQQEPLEGTPATERTEVWLFFDDENVYVVARCWESQPDRIIATEMRRDGFAIGGGANDAFSFTLDTFHDRRNGSIFHVNPLGGRMDGQTTNERQWSPDWNPVWAAAARRFEGGWVAETAVPFKSLRYQPGREQIWGFNARRINRSKNEVSFLSPVPAARAFAAIMQVSLSATVVGLEVPPGAKSLDIKPFVVASGTDGSNASTNGVDADVGVDLRYGLTQNLGLDVTVNTDFAQVEADEQQINLTRFNLFFPEKREFFLENQGLFTFGGVSGFGGDTPLMFYSRRIGLQAGTAVPIIAGGRVTGRTGPWSIGALNMQADDVPEAAVRTTNFSAVRLKRDVLRSSSVGLIATNRSAGQTASGSTQTYGVDGTFRFLSDVDVNTYWAQTLAPGEADPKTSYRAQLDYNADRYGLQLEQLMVEDGFNPEVGFVRRDDIRRSYASARFSPRPRDVRAIRRYSWVGSFTYIENGAGRVEYRDAGGDFGLEFQSGDRFGVAAMGGYEFVPVPFRIGGDATIPPGPYDFNEAKVSYNISQQRRLSANMSVAYGAFYGGHRTTLSLARGRVNVSSRLSLEPSYTVNWIDLPHDALTTHLAGSRVTYSISPLMFVSALVQYNSSIDTVGVNARLRWEYQPGSELFVVYNDDRDTQPTPATTAAGRSVIVKVNRLLRF